METAKRKLDEENVEAIMPKKIKEENTLRSYTAHVDPIMRQKRGIQRNTHLEHTPHVEPIVRKKVSPPYATFPPALWVAGSVRREGRVGGVDGSTLVAAQSHPQGRYLYGCAYRQAPTSPGSKLRPESDDVGFKGARCGLEWRSRGNTPPQRSGK